MCFFLQDLGPGKWGQYDSKGRPVGPGCFLDMSVVAEGYPRMSFTEATNEYHDRQNNVFRAGFVAARDVKRKLLEGAFVEPFHPPTAVNHITARRIVVSVEHAFLTESEILKLTEVGVKALRLGKPLTLQVEDGSVLNGYLFSLKGTSPQETAGLRKVRVEGVISNEMHEELLQAPRQLRQEQGSELYQLACEKQEERLPSSLKPTGRHNMMSFQELKQKAVEVLQAEQISGFGLGLVFATAKPNGKEQ